MLSIVSAINYAEFCSRTDDPIRNFFELTNDEIFYALNYSAPLALWGKLQNVYSTFIWNYMDILVMIVSIGLASKFRQLNDNLLRFKGLVSFFYFLFLFNSHLVLFFQHMAAAYWSERRIQYRNICTLCSTMDDAISFITIISFSNNLYFICVQLLRSLKYVHASKIFSGKIFNV